MKSESLLGIALELIETLLEPGGFPADARMGKFFRQRRFLGSRDRRFLSEAAYGWLRHHPRARGRWDAWAERADAPKLEAADQVSSRVRVLLEVLALATDALFPWSVDDTMAAAKGVAWPTDDDKQFADALLNRLGEEPLRFSADDWPADDDARLAAELSLPVWLATALREDYGAEHAKEIATALARPATVDLRVNGRIVNRETVKKSLEEELDESVEFTPWSPMGLRLQSRKNLTGTRASRKGWIEVADEGSQVVALALDVASGMTVIDACAGAGGKTLTLADALLGRKSSDDPLDVWNRTRLYACDVLPHKLEELERRAADAGVNDWLQTVLLDSAGPLPDNLPPADVVLVDAPCSGLGTLRRNPDLKRRYDASDIERFSGQQLELLERFAPLVKPGGRLAYATCSLLKAENEVVATAFANQHPEFQPYRSDWAGKRLPPECVQGDTLHLDPLVSSTDGFFLAQFQLQLV